MTPTTAELLKYADLQMAAEAFLVDPNTGTPVDLKTALIRGNDHNSKFTETQATEFVKHWEVVAQKPNTSTGFSGTLFRNKDSGELVMSFRSTEFVDDAARDNQATNSLEVADTGFAWGQLRDMQAWYKELTDTGGPLGAGQTFSVTGYSLGGHLASAFNMMYADARQTFTFNSAGIGGIDPATTLKSLVDTFTTESKRDHTGDLADPTLKAIYGRLRAAGESGGAVLGSDLNTLGTLARPNDGNYHDPDLMKQAALVEKAWKRVDTIRKEADRLPSLSSEGGGAGTKPVLVPNGAANIAQESMDYQMAVLSVSTHTDAAGLLAGLSRAYKGKVNTITLDKQFDVVGATSPSAVSNSQWHIGNDVQVFIEDQPLLRGDVALAAGFESLKYFGVKLLVDGYKTKDFGDTHSLVLLVDSLNVQNTLLRMLPEGLRGTASRDLAAILAQASNLKAGATTVGFGQGNAEGDVLENTLNALADLALEPAVAKANRLKGSPTGNTWASVDDPEGYTGRNKFYQLLNLIQNSDLFKKAEAGEVKLQLGVASADLALQAHTDFGAYLALKSLSPFVLKFGSDTATQNWIKAQTGDLYTDWLADKIKLDASGGTAKDLKISEQWLKDRAALLERKDYFSNVNASYDNTGPGAYGFKDVSGNPINTRYDGEPFTWKDLASDITIQRGSVPANARYVVFGTDGIDTDLTAGANNDDLYGGAGDDTLDGKGGDDYLEGGKDFDTYTFTTGFGKDTISDSDGKGKLTLGTQTLSGGEYDSKLKAWTQDIAGETYLYEVKTTSLSATNKQLLIHKQGDAANTITINNFKQDEATGTGGYLSIKLNSTVKLAIDDQPGVNYWATHTDTTSLTGKGSDQVEGGGEALSISLSVGAREGDTITLVIANNPDKFDVILGNSRVPANGAVITLSEGQTDVRIALVQKGDASADIHASISATYTSIDPEANPPTVSNLWGINVKDSGDGTRTFNGDQRPQLDASNKYKWGETTWAADGTLVNGVAEANFNDVIVGTTGVDKIFGKGGNDALGGGDGNDQIDGGDGDDLIAGGNGSDTIKGGAGNDEIFSSADLLIGSGIRKVGLRVGSDDTWAMPPGDILWKKGSTWGLSQDANGQVIFPFNGSAHPDAAGDVNPCLHLSPVCGIASMRYACYRGPRLHRRCHAQFTHAPWRATHGARQA